MATTSGPAVVSQLLDALGRLGKSPGPGPTGLLDDVAPLDVQLLFVDALLADVVSSAPELEPIATQVTDLLGDAPAIVTTDDVVSLSRRLAETIRWLLI